MKTCLNKIAMCATVLPVSAIALVTTSFAKVVSTADANNESEKYTPVTLQDPVVNTTNKMVMADGQEFELVADIDPNTFCTVDDKVVNKDNINVALADGTIKTLVRSEYEQIVSLSLASCNKDITSINTGFLYGCNKLETLDISGFENITEIGKCFMYACTKFNQAELVLPSCLKEISLTFMYGNRSFEGKLVLPTSASKIGGYFMTGCSKFNSKLSLPVNATEIGNNFMSGCIAFDSEIVLPKFLEKIGNSFMMRCDSFKHDLVLPSTLKEIGEDFMAFCENYPKAITIPSSVTSIGD